MSGHSKWSSIKHKKAAQDAKRGKLYTKLIREITVAAKLGGADPAANPRLRSAVQTARGQNMPMDTVNRAISKGAGGNEGVDFEEVTYEGFGPGNVAVVIQALTDNRNRTIASIRTAFNKYNGTLGSPNSVLYMFDRKGAITIPKPGMDEDTLTEIALEAGAEDLDAEGDDYLVISAVEEFEQVKAGLESGGVEISGAELALLPQTRVVVHDREQAEQVMNFLEMLEEDDDVQKVFSNFDIDDTLLAELSA
jgi:YebC/PmpR family DNA-binding regulatory protein